MTLKQTKPIDDDEVVRDGGVVRVPVFMMDDRERQAADALAVAGRIKARDDYVHDISNAWRGAGAKQDQRVMTADEAFADYVQRLENAWRNP
jgi:hypothetical protein